MLAKNVDSVSGNTKNKQSTPILAWIMAGLGCVLFFFFSSGDFKESHFLGGFLKITFGIIFIFITPIAWKIGDFFRKFSHPDVIFASSEGEMFRQRMFWLFGPQSISVWLAFVLLVFLADAIYPIDSNKHAPNTNPTVSVPVVVNREIPTPTIEKVAQQTQEISSPTIAAPAEEVKPVAQAEVPTPQATAAQPTPTKATWGPVTPNADVTVRPTFDCSKAATKPEHLICESKELADSDWQLKRAYDAIYWNSPDKRALKQEQNDWRKNERDICVDDACVLAAYKHRISQLKSS